MKITTKRKDNMVLLNNDVIMEIKFMYCNKDDDPFLNLTIEGKIWKKKKLLYKFSCKSKIFVVCVKTPQRKSN